MTHTEWTIGTLAADGERLGERLARGVGGEWTESREGPVLVFRLRRDPRRPDEEGRGLAAVLTDYIVEECTGSEVAAIVRKRYPSLAVGDRAAVTMRALERYRALGSATLEHQRRTVSDRLLSVLSDSPTVLIEGVVGFSLPQWRVALEEAVDEAADLWVLAREEQEFIRVLKAYRDLEPSGPESIHVLAESGGCRVEDELGRPLDRVVAERDAAGDGLQGEELVAALVSLAPHHLTLHRGVDGAGARIVEGVFGRAATRCPGCERCMQGELRPPG